MLPNECDKIIKMKKSSPIEYIHNVKTPLLICLGGIDRRVPPSQGLQYYHTLKASYQKNQISLNNLKCLIFPEDRHPLDKPATEIEHWIAINNWFKTYI